MLTPTEHAQLLRELADAYNIARLLLVGEGLWDEDEYYDDGERTVNSESIDLIARARQAADEIEGREAEYRFTVTVDDDWMAGGSAPTQEQAEREARHYRAQYESDGDCVATVEHCVEITRFGGGEGEP